MMFALVVSAALMVLVGCALLTPPPRCACVALSPGHDLVRAQPCPQTRSTTDILVAATSRQDPR